MMRFLRLSVTLLFPLLAGAGPLPHPAPDFPPVDGWTLAVDARIYTPVDLWDLIDGAAELFLSYGFQDLTTAEYRNASGTDVRVELYRHDSNVNAFGMYAQERNPEYRFLALGTQGYMEDGVLNFLCGPYYVKLTTHRSGSDGRDAMMLIARHVNAHLGQNPSWPLPLALFPPEGRQPNSETYIAENVLGYPALHSAYFATYVSGTTSFQLFLIDLSSPAQARHMLERYCAAINGPSPGANEGILTVVDPNNGTIHLLLQRHVLSGVLNCPDVLIAKAHLNLVRKRILEEKP